MKIFSLITKTIAFLMACIPLIYAQNPNIRINQVGFYPNATKLAVWVGNQYENFYLFDAISKDTVFKGKLSTQRVNAISQKTTQIADFSTFTKSGKYFLGITEVGVSYTFEIKTNVHIEAAKASLKAFYFQRASTALPEKYAGKWHREAGHPDNKVLIHASAATSKRPEGMLISSPKGWYDAGDYNKYIVNSGITMATLLSLYEDYPVFFKTFEANIPESGNNIPDLLDETLWNLRWMLTMQDPNDGGVYHKLTNPSFDGMLMPEKATKLRYLIQKNTIATLDFAAVMAQASRIFKDYKKELPGLADSCLIASIKAWNWAKENPKVVYRQNEMNKNFEPDILTGGYEDKSDADEWIWAATELYITTKDDNYYSAIELYPNKPFSIPTWNQVQLLAYYSLLRNEKKLTDLAINDLRNLKKRLTDFADELILGIDNQAFNTIMGKSAKDFMWGSSSHAANQGIALLQVYKINADKKYLAAALGNLDYLLGRNATGYSFLTGFGTKQVMFPHHRQSEADGIIEPIPGFLSGGPNPGQQDRCEGYPSKIADESFLDVSCSYSTNEIAINWNAPMVYLTSAIEALQKSF